MLQDELAAARKAIATARSNTNVINMGAKVGWCELKPAVAAASSPAGRKN